MTRAAILSMLAIVATALAGPARGDDPMLANASQVSALFIQSCVRFAGDKEGLRAWAKKTGLRELPAEAKDSFLYGLPGVVFDASNKTGKFVLVSEDGGSCSTLTEIASGTAVLSDLEQAMRDAKISFKMMSDKDDAEEKALRHREYLASQGKREWLLLVSTVQNATGGQAMLTANPY